MKIYKDSRLLPFSDRQLFNVVADISKYPDFLPWCLAASVEPVQENLLKATLTIGYQMFQESYTSRVTLTPWHRIISVQEKGPFKHLENRWEFTAQGDDRCQVDFYLAFEFRSRTFNFLMERVFEKAAGTMIQAFEKRAAFLGEKDN